MAKPEIILAKNEFLILICIILSIFLDKVYSYDFLDLSKKINENVKEKEYNDISYCYWVNVDISNVRHDIFQIDHISSKIKIKKYGEWNSTNYMNFSLFNLPEEIYEDCSLKRFCGILRWDENSKNFLYELIIHNKTSNKLENYNINTLMQFDKPNEKNWIYFCQSFILRENIHTTNPFNNDPKANNHLIKLSAYKNNPKYFNKISIQISKNLFHTDAEFNQLDFNIKIKNTNSFLRAKNLKIFYDIDNLGKMKYLLFNSMFFSSFFGLREFKYLLTSFSELTKNKTIYFNFDEKSSDLPPFNYFEEKIDFNPELFDFPKLLNHLEYKIYDRISDSLYNNYIDTKIKINLTNHMKNFTLKFVSLLEDLSSKKIISYLKNGFSLNSVIETLLNDLIKSEETLSFNLIAKLIEFIYFYHGKIILTNSLGNYENKKSPLDSIGNNLLFDSSKRFEYPLSNYDNEISIPIDHLNSAKFIIFELKDQKNITLFSDFHINYLNDFPYKNLETPNPNVKEIKENIVNQSQDFTFNLANDYKTIVNCFWLNFRNYYLDSVEGSFDFKIAFEVFNTASLPYKKFSISSNFLIFNKTIENFKYLFMNNVKNSETKWDFITNFNPDTADKASEYKANFFNKNWNYFCSFTNLNNNFESSVFINNNQLFKLQDKFTTEFLAHTNGLLKVNITSTKVFLGDFKLNIIPMLDSTNFPNIYLSFKYNGMYNSYENLYFFSLTANLQDKQGVLKLDFLKSVESNENTFINKYLIFDSLEPEITQIFKEGFPKIERQDERLIKFKIRFNPDFVFKLFLNSNSNNEFLFAFLHNFKLLKENFNNHFLNDNKMLLDGLKEYSSIVLSESAIVIKLNERIIFLNKEDLLNEKFFIIENLNKYNSFNSQKITLQIYENGFNICLFSEIFNYFDISNDYRDNSIFNSDKNILNSIDSTAFIRVNSPEAGGLPLEEFSFKPNNIENYNKHRSRIFFSSFYFENMFFNFASIFLKNDKSACLQTNIKCNLFDAQMKNFKSKSFFELNKIPNTDVKDIFYNREYYTHDNFVANYTQMQKMNLLYEDFSLYSLNMDIKFDEYLNKDITELTNKFFFYSYVLQTIEKSRSYVEMNPHNFLELSTESKCNSNSNIEFNSKLTNKASFINFDKPINIHLNTNILNVKNLNWKEDEVIKYPPFSIGKEKLIFTIENNNENSFKMFSEYDFDDNINELKFEHFNDLEFLNVLDNINLKINFLRNHKNMFYIYTIQFDYRNKTYIEALDYNEYFFIDIKVTNEQRIPKHYDKSKTKTEIIKYLENSSENKNTKIKIKIFLERFKYKSFSYYSQETNKLTYYYSLENNFQPLFFSGRKFKLLIYKFFDIEGEMDQNFQINNMHKFQFSNIKIKIYSPKFVSIHFYDVRNYNYNDYDIDVLLTVSGVIFKDNIRISDKDVIPFYNYKKENLILIASACNQEKLFLYFTTNLRYLENPIIKLLKLSVYETYLSFFINPACSSKIKSIIFSDFLEQKIFQSLNQIRSYIILGIEASHLLNLEIEFTDDRKKIITWITEKIKFISPYLINCSNSVIGENDYTLVIFNKQQDLKIKLDYEISNKNLNRLINLNNFFFSINNNKCKENFDIIDSENIYVKYSNQSYSYCSFLIKYFNKFSGNFFALQFLNLRNFLEIRTTQENKIFENIELTTKLMKIIYSKKIIKNIQCSKKMFVLAKRITNFNNTNSFNSFNFEDIINDANAKMFLNTNISEYKYQVNFEKYVDNSNNFLYLEPSKLNFDYSQIDYKLVFTFLDNKLILENIFKNYFKEIENYDFNFLYNYISCKICIANGICDYSNSNVLEFNITDLHINLTQSSNLENFNKTNNDTDNIINKNNDTNQNSTHNNDTIDGDSTDCNKDIDKTKNNTNSSSLIDDLEKNTTNTQSNQTLIIFNLNETKSIISSLSFIIQIQNSSANLSTTSLNEFTNITDIKTKIDTIKSNADLLDKLDNYENKPKKDLIKETINVNMILSKINCSKTSLTNSDECKSTKEYTQEKILKILNKTFDCNKIKDAFLNNSNFEKINYLLDHESFINSVASVHFSSLNEDSFSDKNINIINKINKCLVKYGPDLLNKIENKIVNDFSNKDKKTGKLEDDFLKMITATSSNMIKIATLNNQKEIIKDDYNGTKLNDLVLKNENLDIKQTIERNSLLFLRLNKDLLVSNDTENFTTNNKIKKTDQLKLITHNFVFYAKKSISTEQFSSSSSSLRTNKQKLRFLQPEYEYLNFNEFDMNLIIRLPINYLKNVYNPNITSYSFIFYNKYPLLSPNSPNFNKKVISLKLLDKDFNEIPVFNLSTPIEIFIKRSEKMMHLKKCVFFDEEITNWNTTGCETQEIGEYIICSCNHLTDFSLGKYNPFSLFKDVFSVIEDALIVDDFKVFLKLKFSNAYMLYVFLGILVIYAFALRSAIKKDLRDENDLFVYQIEDEPKFCSNNEIIKKLALLKEMVDGHEEQRKVTALKFLQFKLESSLSEKREIIINNGQIFDERKNVTGGFDRNFIANSENQDKFEDNSRNNYRCKGVQGCSFNLNNEKINNDFLNKNKKNGFMRRFLSKIIKQKESSLKEQTNDPNCDFEDNNNKKVNEENHQQAIELQNIHNIQQIDNFKSKNGNRKENEFNDFDINEKDGSNNTETENSNTDNSIKVSIDGLKVKISNEIVDYKNFLIYLYNEENQEVKKEIEKLFTIERKNSFISTLDNSKYDSEIKRNSIETQNTDIEKANSNAFKNDLTSSTNSNLKSEVIKISFLTSKTSANNTLCENDFSKNDNYFEDSFENSSSFRKKSMNKLIEKAPFEAVKSLAINSEDEVQVRIKNYRIIRYLQILKHFFVNNYRIFCLIFYSNMPFSKTNFLTLIFSRIIATLGVGTMLSLRINSMKNMSSTGHQYNNRELAVSISTIIVVEVIFTVIEGLLKKSKINKNSCLEEKLKIRNRSKIMTFITYFFMFILCLFFIVNTIWITLLRAKNKIDKDDTFIIQFFLSLFLDFFVKEVFVLFAKAYIFFMLIETEEDKKWKKYMISLLAITE